MVLNRNFANEIHSIGFNVPTNPHVFSQKLNDYQIVQDDNLLYVTLFFNFFEKILTVYHISDEISKQYINTFIELRYSNNTVKYEQCNKFHILSGPKYSGIWSISFILNLLKNTIPQENTEIEHCNLIEWFFNLCQNQSISPLVSF